MVMWILPSVIKIKLTKRYSSEPNLLSNDSKSEGVFLSRGYKWLLGYIFLSDGEETSNGTGTNPPGTSNSR